MSEDTKPTVYLAGPIQHAGDRGKGWRERIVEGNDGVEWLNPFDKYDSTKDVDEITREWTNEDIVEEDLKLIARADAVLVHWEEVPTCGTPMEVFFSTSVAPLLATIRALKDRGRTDEEEVQNILAEVGAPEWVTELVWAMDSSVPVVVQTTVPEDEISPWLSANADVIETTFSDAVHACRKQVKIQEVRENVADEVRATLVEALEKQ